MSKISRRPKQRRLETPFSRHIRSQAGMLLLVCSQGRLSIMQWLLPICGGDFIVTILLEAARGGFMEIVQYLLSKSPNRATAAVSPRIIQPAVESGNTELVEFLLERAGSHFDVNSARIEWRSLFVQAIKEDNVEMASLLLSYGACDLDKSTCHVRSSAMAELLDTHGFEFSGQAGLRELPTGLRV